MKKIIILAALMLLSACCTYPTGFQEPNSAGNPIFGPGMYP